MKAYEVASFYSMLNLAPLSKYHLQVCRTTPCWLRGSDDLTKACKTCLMINLGQTTSDGLFTLSEVECIGACINAPAIQINTTVVENSTKETIVEHIDALQQEEANAK